MRTVKIIVATLALAALVIANTTAANSITYVVGNWQITLTDLGVLPGGTASRALAINNAGRIVGLATDSTFALQRPFWDANSGAVTGFAENLDSAGTAVPEQINDVGEMVGTVEFGGRLNMGVFWNPQGQAFALPPLAGVDPLFGSRHIFGSWDQQPGADGRREQSWRPDLLLARRPVAEQGHAAAGPWLPRHGRLQHQLQRGVRHQRLHPCRRQQRGRLVDARVPVARGQHDRSRRVERSGRQSSNGHQQFRTDCRQEQPLSGHLAI